MKRLPRPVRAAGALLLLVLAAACTPVPAVLPAPASSPAPTGPPPAAIQNIVWQWTSFTDQTTRATTTVAEPEKYTITFGDGGALAGRADCNLFGGTYSQEGGFSIKLGVTTMAYCGDASLDRQFLDLLSQVAAGGPDGQGNLTLETAGGAQRMLFANGGAPPVAALAGD